MWKILCVFSFIAFFLASSCEPQSGPRKASGGEISGSDSEGVNIVRGEQIYRQQCVLCHGTDGKMGLNDAGDITESRATLDERILLITNGRGLMMPYRKILTEAEIHSVALYSMKLSE
jgi:cytochrome c6